MLDFIINIQIAIYFTNITASNEYSNIPWQPSFMFRKRCVLSYDRIVFVIYVIKTYSHYTFWILMTCYVKPQKAMTGLYAFKSNIFSKDNC